MVGGRRRVGQQVRGPVHPDPRRLPDHPGGYGDALFLLPEDTWYALTGPGYDEVPFREAKAAGRGLPEDACGRVYVRGLTTSSDPRAVILFDKLATPGGDHCQLPARLFAARGREVLGVGGSIQFVPEDDWPAFATEQVEVLVRAGVLRAEAERLYAQAVR